uniref:Putative YopX protein n=1 Tax=viral metagenome TaxID=1070528 RepID=A0A6M3LMB4_9ZZZZ
MKMRETKFRGWHIPTGKMIDLQKLTPLATEIEGLFLPRSDDVVLMQYAGLKDKNGKEIYEFDIVQRHINLGTSYSVPDLHPFIGIVKFRSSTKGWYLDCRKPIQDAGETRIREAKLTHSETRSEVIGNIYENPELLAPEVKE